MRSEGRHGSQRRLSSRRWVAFAILIADEYATRTSFGNQETLTLASLRLGVRSFFAPLRESWVILARARFERPELRLVLSLPAAVLLLERLQRFLRRRDDVALQRR